MRNKVPRQCGHCHKAKAFGSHTSAGASACPVITKVGSVLLKARVVTATAPTPLIREALHTLHPVREGFASHCLPRFELIISYCFRPKISEDEGVPADPFISSWFVLTRPQAQDFAIFLGSHQP